MFEKVCRLKLRYQSPKGNLSTEDLWDLSTGELNILAKKFNKELKEAKEEDFLEERNKEDTILQLKFDVVLHVLKTKKKEIEEANEAHKRRAKRNKLLEILAKKQDNALENMSEEDILKELESLEK